MQSIRQAIEAFHIIFLKHLLVGADKSHIVLKGGCNLRFFHHSNRYSEDIDFDTTTIAKDTLRKRIEKSLTASGLKAALATHNLSVLSSSAPKQTDTVQRWKIAIGFKGASIPTKIEFSRRGIDHKHVEFGSIAPPILGKYALTPTLLSHYDSLSAIRQKIEALVGRPETQARDIYDLAHLMERRPSVSEKSSLTLSSLKLSDKQLLEAIECALSVSFDQFRGQVVEYLEDDSRGFYNRQKIWNDLQERVITFLEGLIDEPT